MKLNLYSTADVAEITGIDESRIHYAHRSGKVCGPTYFVAGKRIYTDSDLQRVAEFFGVPLKLDGRSNEEKAKCTSNMTQ